ncbi:MAG: PDDEXK nuclease domain-containing protein [Elusimicrobiota bacterium]|jgi:predicted nuclease of restriction endonuclease-like (RecB) superfamily|nr:PDDEXK nuclease domain-containing protein [Elusimicrobiota bacterium]
MKKLNMPKRQMSKNIDDWTEIIRLIENARSNVIEKVNTELVMLYYRIGEFLSKKSAEHSYGDEYIDGIVSKISTRFPNMRGFTRRGLYRMKQFYEIYKDDEIVSTLLTQLTWSNHIQIMSKAKTQEERHFYIKLCVKEHYTARELARQIDSSYYERYMLSQEKLTPVPIEKRIKERFLDIYALEILNMPKQYDEFDFKKAIISNMKNFILEIGRDFSFVGEEYRIQVGDEDYYIDLLFYHRGLSCLVAFELKIDKFKPEYVGKMNFYLEALDREHKKENENPSVGIILCANKNDEVVKFALSRNLSPLLISQYTLSLPNKTLLQQKLHELTQIAKATQEEMKMTTNN